MTVCTACNGSGRRYDGYEDIFRECDRCNGSGEVSEVEMTNEEWMKQANTEQLAEHLLNVWMDGAFNVNAEFGLNEAQIEKHKGYILEWLKQPHN